MEIKSSKPVSLTDAKKVLAERSEEGELGYEQSQALGHAEKFAKFTPDRVIKLLAFLTKNDKIKEDLAINIIDICPTDPATLKAILIKHRVELSEDEIAQIIKELS
jgi:DNA-directed RNA polymerase subunit F